jgi:Family of unknown function (DUF5343)
MVIPAIIATNAIPRYLDSIRKTAVPQAKVDATYLKSIGFKNSNDAALVALFKSLGFLDASGRPTNTYREYRGSSEEDAKRVLGDAIKKCYSGLFALYPDAYRKDDEALTNWMRANTDKGEATQTRALKTFKTLRDLASFDDGSTTPGETSAVNATTSNGASQVTGSPASPVQRSFTRTGPDITINITLQIAATEDASIYDKFFSSMKKNLFPDES